jgi:murein DD-endopeptidase MepM/ murein hydrolase activator NlpD
LKHIRKKKIILLVSISLILVLMGNMMSVFAKSSYELEQERKKNESSLQDTKEQQQKIRSQMSAIQREVEELNDQINNYQAEIDNLADRISETEANIDQMQKELDKTQKELEEKEALLEKRLVASYKAGNTSYLDVLLSSESLTTFLSNYYLIEQLAESDTRLINTIKETKQTIEESKLALEESKVQLEEAKKTQESKQAVLAVVKREKNEKVAALSVEDQALQARIAEKQAEDSRIRAAIKAAEEEERRQAELGGGNKVSPGGYIYPLPAAYCTITTGLYYSNGSYHGAVDFGSGGIYGQPVYAVKAGTVMIATNLTNSYGTYVMLNHHDGTYTIYGHGIRGSICVSQGQQVSQGQKLMSVGSTGNSTGPHLHFEVRVSPGGWNNRVSPYNYLP